MIIYVTHASQYDYVNELYLPLRHSEINSLNSVILPHENSQNPFSSSEFFQNRKCDLVVAEVSYPSTGQGIELGWANAAEIPIVCIFKAGSKLSSSLKTVSRDFIEYESASDLIQKLDQYLGSRVEN